MRVFFMVSLIILLTGAGTEAFGDSPRYLQCQLSGSGHMYQELTLGEMGISNLSDNYHIEYETTTVNDWLVLQWSIARRSPHDPKKIETKEFNWVRLNDQGNGTYDSDFKYKFALPETDAVLTCKSTPDTRSNGLMNALKNYFDQKSEEKKN